MIKYKKTLQPFLCLDHVCATQLLRQLARISANIETYSRKTGKRCGQGTAKPSTAAREVTILYHWSLLEFRYQKRSVMVVLTFSPHLCLSFSSRLQSSKFCLRLRTNFTLSKWALAMIFSVIFWICPCALMTNSSPYPSFWKFFTLDYLWNFQSLYKAWGGLVSLSSSLYSAEVLCDYLGTGNTTAACYSKTSEGLIFPSGNRVLNLY